MSNRLQGKIRLLAIFYLTAIPYPVTFKFFKDHFIHFEPVSVNAVAIPRPIFNITGGRIVLAFVVH
jgi:hypothetical protein